MFGRVTIIGCGLIGGSLVKALGAKRAAAAIAAIDRENVLASVRAYVDETATPGTPAAQELVAESDIVVLATPVASIVSELPSILDTIRPDGVVTDTGSVKAPMGEAIARHKKRSRFVGGHPMTGRELGGFASSAPDLFERAHWFLVEDSIPAKRVSDAAAVARVQELVGAVGAHPIAIAADAHDRAMAYVSHAPQLIASALYGAAASAGVLDAAGPGFRDMTRISGGPTTMWRDIFDANRQAIAAAIADILDSLERVREGLARGDEAGLSAAVTLLEAAQSAKNAMLAAAPAKRENEP
jgi:prephenate dehydrogenase